MFGNLIRYAIEHDEPTRVHPALARLKVQAKRFGFTCTSLQWLGPYGQYDFVCEDGHALQRTAGSLLYGRSPARCIHCESAAKLKRLQTLASWKGGTCLEGDFLGVKVMHRMRCAEGHEWQALGSMLLAGNWCPKCMAAALAAKRITQAEARRKRTDGFDKPMSGSIEQNYGTKQQTA